MGGGQRVPWAVGVLLRTLLLAGGPAPATVHSFVVAPGYGPGRVGALLPRATTVARSSPSLDQEPYRWRTDEIDFCLAAQDSSMSGSSMTKDLNRVSNRVLRELLIRVPSGRSSPAHISSSLESLRVALEEEYTPTNDQARPPLTAFDPPPSVGETTGNTATFAMSSTVDASASAPFPENRRAEEADFDAGLAYFDCMVSLLALEESPKVNALAGTRYAEAYDALRSLLGANGMKFRVEVAAVAAAPVSPTDLPPPPCTLSGPTDGDICLSPIDVLRGKTAALPAVAPLHLLISRGRGAGGEQNTEGPLAAAVEKTTVTQVLNRLSNLVRRTVLFGSEADIAILRSAMRDGAEDFNAAWGNGDATQYFLAMASLLQDGLKVRYDHLKPSYLDAFQRLLDRVVQEMGTTKLGRGRRPDLKMLSEFALWEREVRLNMTGSLWQEHPADMLGGWTLVESDDASLLSSTMSRNNARGSEPVGAAAVTLQPDGVVVVNSGEGTGISWRLDPGPTHLDTCYITVALEPESDNTVTFMGYIDRGQRLESRLSGRSIRMSGLIYSTGDEGDVPDTVSRFVMERTSSS